MRTKSETKALFLFDYKHYRPGDPEFDDVASKVTPIHMIRSEFSDIRTLPFQEFKRWHHGSRHETLDDLYTGKKY